MHLKIIAALWGALLMLIPSVVGRIMLAIGIGYVTYTGFSASVDFLLNQIKSNFSGMPVEAVNLMGYLWVDKAIGMVFSAFAAAYLIKLAGKTSVTKMTVSGPAS